MNRHVPRPRQAQRPSAPATPEFNWERFPEIAGELPPLFRAHWREIALNQETVPLEPDWQRYYEMDLARFLHVLTVRVRGLLLAIGGQRQSRRLGGRAVPAFSKCFDRQRWDGRRDDAVGMEQIQTGRL